MRLPVQAAAGPPSPRTPDGELAILRHVRVAGVYAAPSDRGAPYENAPPRVTPPHTIISRPVHTALAPRRPRIGGVGSGRHDGDAPAVATAGALAAHPAITVNANTKTTPPTDLREYRIPIAIPLLTRPDIQTATERAAASPSANRYITDRFIGTKPRMNAEPRSAETSASTSRGQIQGHYTDRVGYRI